MAWPSCRHGGRAAVHADRHRSQVGPRRLEPFAVLRHPDETMPVLEFKGKQHIYAHHLTVPYRPLLSDPARSCHPAGADDNLIPK